ncbi:Clp protease N-terminal domain-containing protein [Falsiroseomonas sp. E2-1-a20]|uniref:Clp protease N-terminal domain-containing protein n=1 Tax=Falsiroseomonas sp. E2-1-a20 TaxID=3239300 RepID=UPI003F3667E2
MPGSGNAPLPEGREDRHDAVPNTGADLHAALELASLLRHEYATLEHLLVALIDDTDAAAALRASGGDPQALRQDLTKFLQHGLQELVTGYPGDPKPTAGFQRTVQRAVIGVMCTVTHVRRRSGAKWSRCAGAPV